MTLKYTKSCSKKRVPRHLLMTKLTKRYLNENDLLAVAFEKGTRICGMKCVRYKGQS